MKRLALLIVLIASPMLFAQDTTPDTQTGNFLYRFPTGWKPVEQGEATVLFSPLSNQSSKTFIALAATDLEGDLQNSFNQLWAGFKKPYRILDGGQVVSMHTKNGYEAFYTTADAADQTGQHLSICILGAQYKNRLQTVMFMSNQAPGSGLSAEFNVFQSFLLSLRFGEALPGAQVPPAAPMPGQEPVRDPPHAVPAGALEGIYIGFDLGGGGRAGLKRLHFNPDGWVVKDVPQEGMIGFNFTAYRNAADTNRSWVGRYRADGNQISIVWQDYPDNRQVIQRNESSAKPGIDVYVPMCRCTGERFSGKYLWGLTGSGQFMQFFPDGTFLDRGVLDQMLVPSPYYEHPRTQHGTYAIQEQTIIFTFADGRRGMRTFYAPKAQERANIFDFIGLGWHTLYEEHYQSQP
jgi:hypothetical protein